MIIPSTNRSNSRRRQCGGSDFARWILLRDLAAVKILEPSGTKKWYAKNILSIKNFYKQDTQVILYVITIVNPKNIVLHILNLMFCILSYDPVSPQDGNRRFDNSNFPAENGSLGHLRSFGLHASPSCVSLALAFRYFCTLAQETPPTS